MFLSLIKMPKKVEHFVWVWGGGVFVWFVFLGKYIYLTKAYVRKSYE